jgi:hypothetical protein
MRTGRDLRELDSRSLYDVGYYLMRRDLPTEDEAKARDRIDQAIYNQMFEEESGLPAVSQWMQPADAKAPADAPDVPPDQVFHPVNYLRRDGGE